MAGRFTRQGRHAAPGRWEKGRGLVKVIVSIAALLVLATSAFAIPAPDELNGPHVQLLPQKSHGSHSGWTRKVNVIYHNGPVIHQAKVVSIFWGPAATWGTVASPSTLAATLPGFFAQFGATPQYNVITQYYDFGGSIRPTNLTAAFWIDNSPPPTSVSDTDLRNAVIRASSHVGLDRDTVYEVFLPPTSYASLGGWTSCGGPNVQFCAYHSNFAYLGTDVKYASLPYPGCGGCQMPGWTVAQNLEHFAGHETREAVTDPDGTAWFDRQGSEADDKCAWSPPPFLVNGYGYQYEWSNLDGGCVGVR